MSTSAFDAFAREMAAGVSRRTSLLTLGGAALAAGATNAGVSAAKKMKGKNCKKKENQRCRNDAAACAAQIPGACESEPSCTVLATLCCQECSADSCLTCVLANQPARSRRTSSSDSKETTMNTHAFDAVTQQAAAGLSRRNSLLTLGGAGLAATMASPQLAAARKKGKDCKKKEKQRCSNDAAACKATLAPQCAGDPVGCAILQGCCDRCSAGSIFLAA